MQRRACHVRVALVLLAVVLACATSPTGRRQLMLISEERAIAASKEAYLTQLAPLAQDGLVDNDPKVVARIRKITGRLITEAIVMRPDTADWEWSVAVIDDPKMVNAWCMAGGRMAIYTGLIQQLDATDDEIAQVMGHEIAHALANHTAERMSVAIASTAAAVAGGTALAIYTDRPAIAMSGAAAAAVLAIKLPNSRASESEADVIGIELAARAGYDPRAAQTLWQKMGAVGGTGPPEFLSTHPSPTTRQRDLAALAPQWMDVYRGAKAQPPPVHPL